MKWISVKDRLPKNMQRIISFNSETNSVHAGAFYEGPDRFCLDDGVKFDPQGKCCDFEEYYTHWMPLPELPTNG